MAGGMTPSRSGLTLAERSAQSGVGAAAGGGPPSREFPRRSSRTSVGCPRHCWVSNLPDVPGRWPGLALEWARQADGSWTSRVAYAVRNGDQVVLVEAWVLAQHLTPADG